MSEEMVTKQRAGLIYSTTDVQSVGTGLNRTATLGAAKIVTYTKDDHLDIRLTVGDKTAAHINTSLKGKGVTHNYKAYRTAILIAKLEEMSWFLLNNFRKWSEPKRDILALVVLMQKTYNCARVAPRGGTAVSMLTGVSELRLALRNTILHLRKEIKTEEDENFREIPRVSIANQRDVLVSGSLFERKSTLGGAVYTSEMKNGVIKIRLTLDGITAVVADGKVPVKKRMVSAFAENSRHFLRKLVKDAAAFYLRNYANWDLPLLVRLEGMVVLAHTLNNTGLVVGKASLVRTYTSDETEMRVLLNKEITNCVLL